MVYELLPMDTHQWLKVFAVLCFTLNGVAVAGDLNLEYFVGVPRFNSNTGYIDYYVHCNAQGSSLVWQVGTDVGTNRLAGFGANDAGRVIVNARSAYEYTATLLSSRPLPAGNQYQMDSVIVVTFIGMTPSEFLVTCISNTNTSTITVMGNTSAVRRTDSSGHNKLVLDYVIKIPIMQNKEFTDIFMCGTIDVQQYYEYYGVDNNRIGFNTRNEVGQKRLVRSADGFTVTILGILIGRQPYNLTSILFISGNSGVNVTCFDRNYQVHLLSDSSPVTTPTTNAALPPDTSTSHFPSNPLSSSPPEPPVSSPSSTPNTPPRPDMTSTPSITTDVNVNVIIILVVVVMIIILVVVVIVVVVIPAALLLPSCICCCKCYRSGKCSPVKKDDDDSPKKKDDDDSPKKKDDDDSPKKKDDDGSPKMKDDDDSSKKITKDDPSYSQPAQTETSFGTNCNNSGGSSSPKVEDQSKKIDSEESDSEGYSSGIWSASEDGFSDDELLRKLMESWCVSDRQEERNCLHHFVWANNKSYTYDNLVFLKDSKSPYSKTAETSIVVDGHTKEIQDAVNDVVFVRPSKIPRVYSRRVMSFSIADGLKQEVQDSSSSSKAVYISHCSSETNSSKVTVSTGSPDVVVCKESPDVAAVVIAAGNPFKMVRVLSKNDNVCVMKEGYALESEESLTVNGSQCQSEEGSKVISSEKLQLQPVKNLEKRISMVVQGAGDLTGGSGARLLPGMLEGNTSAIIGTCWYNKRAVLIVGEGVRCQKFTIVLNVYKDKEAGSQGESPEGLINTPKMVTVQQVMTEKLVANNFDYWMQVIHCHVLHKRKTHSSLVHALVSQDASLKTHSLSCRMPGYFNLGPHHQHPYLKLSKGPQQDNRQRILSESSNRPMSTGRSSQQKTRLQYHQQQQYFHEGQFYKDSFQMAIIMLPDHRGMVLVHEPPDSGSPPFLRIYCFSHGKKISFWKQQSLDSTPALSPIPALSLMSLSSMSSNSSSTCSQSNSGVEGGKAGSAGTIEDRLKTKMTPGVQVSDPNVLDIVGPTNLLVVNELRPFPLPPGKVHRLVQPCSLKVATPGWGQVAKTRNFSK